MISAVSLSRRFGPRVAVDGLSFEVQRGEIVALLGPNGAGKTTTLRMLAGIVAPTSGSIVIDNVPLTRATSDALRGRIGFLPEAPGLWDRLTVHENLRTYARLYRIDAPERAVDRMLDLFGLGDRATTRAAELSKGLRQRVALARTLLHDPPVLLLDEPTSGLDPEITRSVRHLLGERRASGSAIIVSTHNLDEAERLSDRVAVLRTRLLAVDRPAALRRRLTTGHVTIRVAGEAASLLDTVRAFDPGAEATDATLAVRLADAERDTPGVVRALVARGAAIVEVRSETPDLEAVYLRLVESERGSAPC